MTRASILAATGLILVLGLAGGSPAHAGNVSIGVQINVPPPPIVLTAPPSLVVVPGTPVSYAPAASYNYFSYG